MKPRMLRPVPTAARVAVVLASCYLLPGIPTSVCAVQPVPFQLGGGSTPGGAAAREWWRVGVMRLRGGGVPGDRNRRGGGEGRSGDRPGGFGEAVESLAMFDQEVRPTLCQDGHPCDRAPSFWPGECVAIHLAEPTDPWDPTFSEPTDPLDPTFFPGTRHDL